MSPPPPQPATTREFASEASGQLRSISSARSGSTRKASSSKRHTQAHPAPRCSAARATRRAAPSMPFAPPTAGICPKAGLRVEGACRAPVRTRQFAHLAKKRHAPCRDKATYTIIVRPACDHSGSCIGAMATASCASASPARRRRWCDQNS